MSEFCSLATRAAGQSIVGTASADTSAWVVIEFSDAWARKAFETAPFDPAVREHVDRWIEAIPGVRPQLIRRPGRDRDASIVVYLGVSQPGVEQLREFELPGHEALLQLDAPAVIEAMRAGRDPGVGVPVQRPVVLVCTHGKRDRCCAKWGTPVYESLQPRDDIVLWQTSHLGGHRFAATMLCLPQGLCYGWVQPDEVNPVIDAHVRGDVARLDRMRGRTALSGPGQAAEHFVRDHTGITAIDAVRVEEVREESVDRYVAVARAGVERYQLSFSRVESHNLAPGSCGKDPEPVHRYELSDVASI